LVVGGLHLGLVLPNYGDALDAGRLAATAVAAEEAGFDSGWVTDHLIVPAELAPVYGTIAEALVSLGFLAGTTRRIQLGVSALIVPQRNPLVVLKQVTSLDFLSGGRIVMAVAVGWLEGEFATLGSHFDRRGRLLDDWLELASSAFAQMPGPVEHDGALAIDDGWLAPGLVRSGGIELWVAGVSDVTLRRAAGTGVWHPVALAPAKLSELAVRFRQRRADGRIVLRLTTLFADEPDPRSTDERGRHAVTGPPQWIAERLAEYVEGGCNGFVVNLGHDVSGLEDRVQRFAEEVWPPVVVAS
jgi:alkanesulfonate monooxygenase SsuD/methylene tetrahydromethanopterin reductase-like flavin-dependent oxidoreductase (luciferase family)